MKARFVYAAIAVIVAGGLMAESLAAPPTVPHPPRGNFMAPTAITIGQVCYAIRGPLTNAGRANIGIDANGPYFSFWTQSSPGAPAQAIAYRPRGQIANTVTHTGDGAIAAVEHFRKLYERWARNQGPNGGTGFNFANNNDKWVPNCLIVPPGHPASTTVSMSISAEEWMAATQFFILLDPLTFCFEDYDFEYYPGS